VPAPTNSERIEANTTAIRTAESIVAVHEERIESLHGAVKKFIEEFDTARESLFRIDERLKHVEQKADRRFTIMLSVVNLLIGGAITLLIQWLVRVSTGTK
jgi:hypothetical protein